MTITCLHYLIYINFNMLIVFSRLVGLDYFLNILIIIIILFINIEIQITELLKLKLKFSYYLNITIFIINLDYISIIFSIINIFVKINDIFCFYICITNTYAVTLF